MALIGTARLVATTAQLEYKRVWTGTEFTRTLYTKVYECEADAGTALQDLGSPGGDYTVTNRGIRVKQYSFALMRCTWSYRSDWVEVT